MPARPTRSSSHSFISKLTVTKWYESHAESGLSHRNAYTKSSTRPGSRGNYMYSTCQHWVTELELELEREREASYHVHNTSVTACPRALSTITAPYTCTCTCILVHRRDFCVHQSQRSKGGFSCKAAQALLGHRAQSIDQVHGHTQINNVTVLKPSGY